MTAHNIGFIGAGHLNSAIISGLLESGSFAAKNLFASAKTQETAVKTAQTFGIQTTTDNCEILANCPFIVLGVKPQQMQELLTEIADYDLSDTVIITLAAGIRIADYRKILGDGITIIRAMPNMAAAVQSSLTGIYSDDELDEETETLVDSLFAAIGSTAWLDDETQIDGIVALSGSGIAYFFRIMQSMMEAGGRYGFEKDELYDIIALTALGAATLTLESESTTDFTDFVNKIVVKGGTTEAALQAFSKANIDAVLEEAMQNAVTRSNSLSEQLTKDW